MTSHLKYNLLTIYVRFFFPPEIQIILKETQRHLSTMDPIRAWATNVVSWVTLSYIKIPSAFVVMDSRSGRLENNFDIRSVTSQG